MIYVIKVLELKRGERISTRYIIRLCLPHVTCHALANDQKLLLHIPHLCFLYTFISAATFEMDEIVKTK